MFIRSTLICVALLMPVAAAPAGAAEYDQGADDDRILIGSTQPYSGPASASSALGQALAAFARVLRGDEPSNLADSVRITGILDDLVRSGSAAAQPSRDGAS